MSIDYEDELERDRKRAQFVTEEAPKPNRAAGWVGGIVAVALLIGGGVWYWGSSSSGDTRTAASVVATPTRTGIAAGAATLRIPLADLASGQAKFFEHRPATGQPVRFFAVKSSDGTNRVALDACEICFAGGKGYQQAGEEMVCQKCGRSFPIEAIDEGTDGCHPLTLPRTIEGTDLVVQAKDVEQINAKYAAKAGVMQ